MMREYKKELTKLGDGDPYVGLERAGVADWIKEGKDPEAEWACGFLTVLLFDLIRIFFNFFGVLGFHLFSF